MSNDEQIRRVILASLPDPDEERGWAGVQARIAPAKRRRRITQVATAMAAVAVLVGVGFGARTWLTDRPDVADSNDTTTTSTSTPSATECLDPRVGAQDVAYLERWTVIGTSLRTDRCVLAGIVGPEPEVIPDGLGVEMPLHPDRLPSDEVLPRSELMPEIDWYPIVHLGQVSDTNNHGYLYWVGDSVAGTPTPIIGGAIGHPGDTMAALPGIWAVGRGDRSITVHVVVPDEASIVALDIDGLSLAWQRPVAKAAVFVIDETQLESSPDTITVTVYDKSGIAIDQYQQQGF
jgi:hypothetical protein